MGLSQKLVESASTYARHFAERGFHDIVISAKTHDVRSTVDTYRMLARELPDVSLHLGVTEAGTARQGTIKSAAAMGALLLDGIGDTIRVSLTAPPVEEVRAAWDLLAAVGARRRSPELISCPTCGRCQVDLMGIAARVERRLQAVDKPISVAVMGCVVNGPGEASNADIGVACGRAQGSIFKGGHVLYSVPEDKIVDALFDEIDRL
jgi:(E)-4-hydroxy-3-methylbut-2-enyl-diphosphate synthase